MKSNYFVFRVEKPRSRGGEFEGVDSFDVTPESAPNVTAETAQLSPREALDVQRDPNNDTVMAEDMPVELIMPLAAATGGADEPAVAEAKAAGASWGIASVLGDKPSPYTGEGVVVAVLDTGIDAGHAAFAGVAMQKKNFTDDGPADDVTDFKGHGTHCAGTIFGRNVDGVRIGVAPGVKNALIGKVLDRSGSGSTSGVLHALIWAFENKADIVSMSLGFSYAKKVKQLVEAGRPPEYAASRALQAYRENMRAFEKIVALLGRKGEQAPGAIVIAAAGNDSRRDLGPDFVIDVALPAATLDVLSVGALGRAGEALAVARFSNVNPMLCAPGVDIVSAKVGGGLTALSGTSMACPHAAGVAALWWQRARKRNPGARADTVQALLRGRLRALDALAFADCGEGFACGPSAND